VGVGGGEALDAKNGRTFNVQLPTFNVQRRDGLRGGRCLERWTLNVER
jgi:hypothetical protein